MLSYDPPPRPINVPNLSPATAAAGLPPADNYGGWEIPLDNPSPFPLDPSLFATCGRCTRCLDACPTNAFVGPYHLDPQRCISYWTIEARSPIPRAFRVGFGNRIFGCDICQEVCPWNKRLEPRTPLLRGLQAQESRIAPPLLEGFQPETPYWLDASAFAKRFHRSPIKRAKRAGMLRNVCVALGNWADAQTIPALTRGLHDPDSLPRGHAAWALGQVLRRHGHVEAAAALAARQIAESDEWVRAEIAAALGGE